MGTTVTGGFECRWGRQKSRFSTNIWLSDRWLVECKRWQSSSRWHLTSLFTAQPATLKWILFITAPAAWTTMPERTEHKLFACIGKCEAIVTNNGGLRSRYCTVEANYWHSWSIAWRFCDSRASSCSVTVLDDVSEVVEFMIVSAVTRATWWWHENFTW